jgi:predicted nucleic acid-binding Zn ribbon protein
MDTSPQAQICLDCGLPIVGRIDKKFCGDSCRTHYNNLKKQATATMKPAFLKEIPKIINTNYRILKELNQNKPTKVRKAQLEKLGFNFQYLTSCYTTAKGDTYRFCFDQGYLEIKEGMVLLVQQDSQVLF